jgi:biopolymer transport protein ExbD
MKPRRALRVDPENTDINISPLIDMVFILLIFFIVTTVFVEETGVEVRRPEAASSVDLERQSILIAITAAGEVYYGGEEIGVGGVRPAVRRLLQDELMPVILQVDEEAAAGTVVRVIDQAKLGGAESISIAADRP